MVYPVGISAEEATVVGHLRIPASILMRSGAGKTTCLVHKLVGRYLCRRASEEPLRQVCGCWVSEIGSCSGGSTLTMQTVIGLTHGVKKICVEVEG